MSGPKRADVQAALNIAARSAQASAAVISRADRDAVGHMSRRLSDALKDATSLGSSLEQAAEALAHVEHQGSDTESARKAVEAALAALGSGLGGTVTLAGNSRDADAAEDLARQAYDEAQAEYDKAEQGLRQAGSHYLHNQMAWAQNARMKFDEAGQLAQRAAELRTGSKRAANKAVERAEAAVAEARRALSAAGSASRAAGERARAAAEAARIAEERRRVATSALAEARIAVDSLNAEDVDKFAPGTRNGLGDRVGQAETALASGDFEAVHRAVSEVVVEAQRIAQDSSQKRRKWDEDRAAALAAQGDVSSVLGSVDADLVSAWASDRDAVESGRIAVSKVDALIVNESFDEAVATANSARDQLQSATATAAAAHGQNLRRQEIGEAVMDVLEDLGFDLSFEEGTRDTPLRINGQTATPDGRGDFDIEIPLDGEIDFEVTAPEGDVSCVNAIRSLQEQLAQRGIDWTVTDWGHAEGHVDGASRTKTQSKTQTRTRSRG